MGLIGLLKKCAAMDGPREIDPAVFDDPVAVKTDWTSCSRWATDARTHKLTPQRPDCLAFTASLGMKAFVAIFILVGIGALVATFILMDREDIPLPVRIFIPIMGVWFCTGAPMFGRAMSAPRTFDQSIGYYWKGRGHPELAASGRRVKDRVKLDHIHALQIIEKRVRNRENSYNSSELNLVLNDASRVHVILDGRIDKLRVDAQTLSYFLDVPLWDATVDPYDT
jgi:hypothetical protein